MTDEITSNYNAVKLFKSHLPESLRFLFQQSLDNLQRAHGDNLKRTHFASYELCYLEHKIEKKLAEGE